jgi:rhomboid protease GluP
VGANAAVFVVMLFSGVSVANPNTAQLLTWGANWGPLSLGPQPWRILSSNYLHIGIIHIALNMWCLWSLGQLAERIFDRWTYFLTYTACGIGGSLASLWWHPMVVGAGASGAIFGLAGALISALYLGRLPIPKEALRGTMRSLLIFAGYNLFFGAVGAGIDNSAHIGGLITGLALGAVLARHLTDPPEIRTRWNGGVFTVTALILFGAFNFLRHDKGNLPQLPAGETTWSIPSTGPFDGSNDNDCVLRARGVAPWTSVRS